MQASTSLSQMTKFIVQTYDPKNGNTVTFNMGYDLDNNADVMNPANSASLYTDAASSAFTVTTTPEPASAGIFLASTLLLLKRHRRRNESN